MDDNRLTIAIPVYNRTEFFAEALESALQQTIPVSIVVVDNCSPHDEFERIVEGLDRPDVRYVRNASNLGMEGNWNACIEQATTPYLTILHDDDTLHPRFAESWAQTRPEVPAVWASGCSVGESSPFAKAATTGAERSGDGEGKLSLFEKRRFLYSTLSPFPGVVFPRQTTVRFQPNMHGAADYLFWYELSNEFPVYKLKQKLAFYRRSSFQASSNLFSLIIEKLIEVRERLARELQPGSIDRLLDRFTRLITIETYESIYKTQFLPPPQLAPQILALEQEFRSPLRRLACRALLRLRRL